MIIRKLLQGPKTLVEKINKLIEAANAFSQMTGDGLINVHHTPTRATLRIDTNALQARMPKRGGGEEAQSETEKILCKGS